MVDHLVCAALGVAGANGVPDARVLFHRSLEPAVDRRDDAPVVGGRLADQSVYGDQQRIVAALGDGLVELAAVLRCRAAVVRRDRIRPGVCVAVVRQRDRLTGRERRHIIIGSEQ